MVAKRIAQLRKEAGMNQAQLAAEINVTPSAVGMYEQGRRYPSVEILIAIAKLFNVSLDYLVTGSEYPDSLTHSSIPVKRTPENCPCTTCYWKNFLEK